ncbi:MAG TPA: RHS repeat-associated core domain-containing protein, partial [Oleiagrimonas sp.]|nr:RHS repeat-associated core domain-containing protein [Oleiagrimonas sp.]
SASNKYDGHGRRVERIAINPNQTRDFIYEGTQLLAEYAAGNNDQREYLWLGHDLVASLDTTPKATTVHYVVTDFLGSPRRITTAAGQVIWSWLYVANPFGERDTQGSYTMNLRFPGQYHDALSGLNYNVNRNYGAAIGRYIESDPIGIFPSVSTYAYVGSNPYTEIDPHGLWQVTISFGALLGGEITFGHNSGQWNFGGYIGVGEGLSGSFDPNDSGVQRNGTHVSVISHGLIGLGDSVEASTRISADGSTSIGIGANVLGSPVQVGISETNGCLDPPSLPTIGAGESAFVGTGAQYYW